MRRFGVQASLLAGGIVSLVGGFMLSGRAAQADEFSSLVLSLAMLVTAAKIGGDLAGRFGQPAVLGELAAGVLLGNLTEAVVPNIYSWFSSSEEWKMSVPNELAQLR